MASPTAAFPFPEAIDPPAAAGSVAVPVVSGGPDLRARNYRDQPSAGQDAGEGMISLSRDEPNALGTAVSPPPDLTIQSYDLPDQLARYDRTADPPIG